MSPRVLAACLLSLSAGLPAAAGAQDGPPPFVEAGRTYTMFVAGEEAPVEVLETTRSPWVRARVGDMEIWINLSAVHLIQELSPEDAARRQREARTRPYLSVMRSDLRNLMSAQEIHYGSGAYAYSEDLRALDFHPSRGVTIEIGSADLERGYWARARHEAVDVVCAVIMGEEEPRPPATESGRVACTDGGDR